MKPRARFSSSAGLLCCLVAISPKIQLLFCSQQQRSSDLAYHSLLLPHTFAAIGCEYYVSRTGSDLYSGSKAEPFKTLQKAADTLGNPAECPLSSATVYVESGLYEEPVKVSSTPPDLAFIGVPTFHAPPQSSEVTTYAQNASNVIVTGKFSMAVNASSFTWHGIEVAVDYTNASAWELTGTVNVLTFSSCSFTTRLDKTFFRLPVHLMTIGTVRDKLIFTNSAIQANYRGYIASAEATDTVAGSTIFNRTVLENIRLVHKSPDKVYFYQSVLENVTMLTLRSHYHFDNSIFENNVALEGCSCAITNSFLEEDAYLVVLCGYNGTVHDQMTVMMDNTSAYKNSSIQLISRINISFNATNSSFIGDSWEQPVLVITRLNDKVTINATAWYNYWGDPEGPWSCCNPDANGRYLWELVDFSHWCYNESCLEYSPVSVSDSMCVMRGVCDDSGPAVFGVTVAINFAVLLVSATLFVYYMRFNVSQGNFIRLFKLFLLFIGITLVAAITYVILVMAHYMFYGRPELAHNFRSLEPFMAVIMFYLLIHVVLLAQGMFVYIRNWRAIKYFFIFSLVVITIGMIQLPVFLGTASYFITLMAEVRDTEEITTTTLSFPPEITFCYLVTLPCALGQVMMSMVAWKIFVIANDPALQLLNEQIKETASLVSHTRSLRISESHKKEAVLFLKHFVGVAVVGAGLFSISIWLQFELKRQFEHNPLQQFELFFFIVEPLYSSAAVMCLSVYAFLVMRYRHYETPLLWAYVVIGSFVLVLRLLGILGAVIYLSAFFSQHVSPDTLAGFIINAIFGFIMTIWQTYITVYVSRFRRSVEKELPTVMADNLHNAIYQTEEESDPEKSLPRL